jgi:ABC-type sugar transport system ATPase subunit
MSTPALSVLDCTKTYPSVRALTDVSISVSSGEIRGLVGQNGAGKSTLIKIIAGAIEPDSGVVELDGAVLKSGVVQHPRAGISVIYQDPQSIPELSALENVFLGDLRSRFGIVRQRAMLDAFAALCSRLSVTIDPDARAEHLSLGDRQLLEIMRALRDTPSVLVLDEPTSALPEHERRRLFDVMRTVRASGVAVVFISHDLDEVLEVCDSVTVLRDGTHVATRPVDGMTVPDLIGMMTGETPERYYSDAVGRELGAERLRVEDLRSRTGVDHATFSVRSGEIVGLAGLLGSGRTEILRVLAGADRADGGTLEVDGTAVPWPRTVTAAKRLGVQMVPEDRRGLGLIGEQTVTENISLGTFDLRRWLSWISNRHERARQRDTLRRVHFQEGREGQAVRTLSGGNQQKVLLARLLQERPDVILLDEPTAGIDVKASAQILHLVRELAASGSAVVVVLSDLQELIHLCDRMYVVRAGRIEAEFQAGEVTEGDLLDVAFAAVTETSATA